ncbi:hypothetical protein [Macrococcus equi]|uniref:hypothetical protein n=1 Tax=Macrococcus equi TaxID=3395462 RepID=UPI0039BECD66
MSILIFLLSSGIMGLYTYINLSRLSILGNENEETKKLYLSMFSVITMLIFVLVFSIYNKEYNLSKLFTNINIFSILISLFWTIILVWLLNNFIYPLIIKMFRKSTNNDRNVLGKSKIVDELLIDTVLDNNKFINYVELFKSNDDHTLIEKGLLKNYEIDKENNINVLIESVNLNKEKPGVSNRIDSTLTYYSSKNDMILKVTRLNDNQSPSPNKN